MSDPVPDDQLATFFERFRAEVSAQARPANAQVRRRARRHRSTRVAGAALTAGVVVAAPLSVYAAAGHGVAGPVGGTRAPASGPPASAAGAPVTATCVAATVPDAAFPSPPHGGGQQTTPQTGPLLYLQATAGRDGTVKLVSWTPGHSTVTTKLSLPAEAVFNANVSRDGRWVSWVAANGDLHLHSLTGGGDRVLRHHVDGRTLEPVWGPDSARLLIRDVPSGKVGTVAVPSGAYSPLAGDLSSARHAVWASDGSAIAFIAADGWLVLAKPDGTGQRRVPQKARFLAEGRRVASLESLSATTSGTALLALSVTEPGALPGACRSLVSNAELNVSTGEQGQDEAQLGGDYVTYQGTYRGPAFTKLSRMLSRPRSIDMLGGNGEYLGGAVEPASLAGYLLLS